MRGGEGARQVRSGGTSFDSPRLPLVWKSEANAQADAGTRAWNSRGRLSNPPTIVLARTKMRLPAGTVPNAATYSDVMSAGAPFQHFRFSAFQRFLRGPVFL